MRGCLRPAVGTKQIGIREQVEKIGESCSGALMVRVSRKFTMQKELTLFRVCDLCVSSCLWDDIDSDQWHARTRISGSML